MKQRADSPQNDNFSIFDLLELINRNKWIVAPVMAITIAVTTFYHYYRPIYKAESLILAKQQGNSPLQEILGDMARMRGMVKNRSSDNLEYQTIYLQSEDFFQNLISQVGHDPEFLKYVALEGIKNPNQELLVGYMRGSTSVRTPREDILSVGFRASHTESAVYFTNLLAKHAIEIIKENDLRELRQAKDYIENQRQSIANDLKKSSSEVLQLQKGVDNGDGRHTNTTLKAKIGTVEEELTRWKLKLSSHQILIAKFEEELGEYNKDQKKYADRDIAQRDVEARLKGDIQSLRQDRATLFLQGYMVDSPEVVKLSQDIAKATASLEKLKKWRKVNPRDLLFGDPLQSLTQLADLKRETLQFQAKVHTLEKTRAELVYVTGKMLEMNSHAENINRKIDLYYGLLGNLEKKLFELKVDEISISSRFGIMETAKYASAVRSVGLGTKIFSAALASLIMGWLLAYAYEAVWPKIRRREDLERLGLAVFGVIPQVNNQRYRTGRRGLKVVAKGGADSPESMAFKQLRHRIMNLRLNGSTTPPKVVTLLSAEPNSGKSFVTLNLAVSTSQIGGRTLLLDGDVRKGTITSFLELSDNPGLAEVLAGSCSPENAIVKSKFLGLDFLPAGKYVHNITELMANGKIDGLFAELKKHYNHILVDSTPIWVADSIMLAQNSDVYIVVAREKFTRQRQLVEALQELDQLEQKYSFSVLNGVAQLNNYYIYMAPDEPSVSAKTPKVISGGASSNSSERKAG